MTDANGVTAVEGKEPRTTRRAFVGGVAAAAATAAGAPGDISETETEAQRDRLRDLADRDEADRWVYETQRNLASVSFGMMDAQLDALCDSPGGAVELFAVDDDGVPVAFEVSTPDGERIGNLVHLSAEDAEALAVDLLEQAHAHREARVE